MKIAIPAADDKLCPHFGHCEYFVLMDVDTEKKEIEKMTEITSPPHQPGMLPQWLADQDVDLIIAGGMGARALDLFNRQNIKVIIGANSESPEKLVNDFLAGNLQSGANVCDH